MEHPKIAFDEAAIRAVATQAIVSSLTPEQKTIMVARAIEYLTAYDQFSRKTPLENAFNDAVKAATLEILRERFATDPEVKKATRALVDRLLERTLFAPTQADEIAKSVADQVVRAIKVVVTDR